MSKPRAFATAWTVFTMLAAPAVLGAQEAPPAPEDQAAQEPPAADQPPAAEPAPAPAPAPEPAPEPAERNRQAPADPAPAPAPAQEAQAPAAEPAPEPEPQKQAKPKARIAASASVSISDFEFGPSSVTVNVGDTVTWTNQGPSEHTATGSGFDTGLLAKGGSGSASFGEAGSFSYICTPHPFMKGTVTVQAADTGSDPGVAGQEDQSLDTGSGDEAGDGPSLPNSGGEAWALALLGTGLLSLGFAVRRRVPEER